MEEGGLIPELEHAVLTTVLAPVLLLFEVGSFCNFCGNLPALCFFRGRRCDGSVCSIGTVSGIGSVVGGMCIEVVGEASVFFGFGG